MEKVLDIVKGLFAGFVELVMHPVSKVTETVQKEDIKKGAIKAAILAAVLAVVNVLSTIRAIYLTYSSSKQREIYVEALNPIVAILKTFAIYLLGIAVVALILFVISKLVKDQKSLPYTLSMTVNSSVVYAVGYTLALVLSFWTPLSVLVLTIASLHSGITLLVSFMSSLTNVNTDQLVLVGTVVLVVVSLATIILKVITTDISLTGKTDAEFKAETQIGDIELSKKQYEKLFSSDVDDALSMLGAMSSMY